MASPYCCVRVSRVLGVRKIGRYPFIRYWSIPATGIEWDPDEVVRIEVGTAPDDHFGAGPHRTVHCSAIRRVSRVSSGPAVLGGIISSAGAIVSSAPDDHFKASPYCGVVGPAIWRVNSLRGRPIAGCGFVQPSSVQVALRIKVETSPNNHLAATPYGGMSVSCHGRAGVSGNCPVVHCGIVLAAGVQVIEAVIPSPNNHFVAGPDCRV